jgi:putative ABC transport system substrate-binding protein
VRPGGNITGFTTFEYSIGGKWLELLKDTTPGATRMAIIFDPRNPTQAPYVQGIEASAPSFRRAVDPRARARRGERLLVTVG